MGGLCEPGHKERWQTVAGGDRKNADTVLIAALAGGATVEDAAKTARVSERTAYRRLEGADFRAQVAEARRAMVERTVAQLADAGTAAAATLRALLDAEAASVRLGAARAMGRVRARHDLTGHATRSRVAPRHGAAHRRRPDRHGGTPLP